MENKGSVVILCAGGPAPGINCVIASVAKTFLAKGFRVIGLDGGYKSLVSSTPKVKEIDFLLADSIINRGGSVLGMSRYKPKDEEFSTPFFVENNVKLLVTIGGDDTASTANRLSKYLRANEVNVSNIHVPKTIDNDLPLPFNKPTFGFTTAVEQGASVGMTIYEDARTSGNWFVLVAMGREAGHLAFNVGAACHYPMIVVPEMFNNSPITIDKIVRLIISSVLKRELMGIGYGAAIISEGVFHFIDEEEFEHLGICFPTDDHGHIELSSVSKAHLFSTLVANEFEKLGLAKKCRANEMGYELRCCAPSGADMLYTTKLGLGVYELYEGGCTGCMVTLDDNENVKPLYLEDVEDACGKIQTRLLDVDRYDNDMIFKNNLHFIIESDYDEVRKLIPNPEHYDFEKILFWEGKING